MKFLISHIKYIFMYKGMKSVLKGTVHIILFIFNTRKS